MADFHTVGSVNSVDISTSSVGVTVGGGPIIDTGTLTVNLVPELNVISGFTSQAGIVVRQGGPGYTFRSIVGTSNQIDIVGGSGSGVSGNPTIALSSNAIMPGLGGVTIPKGSTAQRAGNSGTIRFNTSSNKFEGTSDGINWDDFINEESNFALTGDVSGSGPIGTAIATTLSNTIDRPGGQVWNYGSSDSFSYHLMKITNSSVNKLTFQFLQGVTPPFSGYKFSYFRSPELFLLSYTNNGIDYSIISSDPTDNYTTIYYGLHMNNKPIDNVSTISVGRAPIGSVGGARLELYGTNASASAGPHMQCVTSADNYPNYQLLAFSHDNISTNYDAYYDGSWRSAHAGSNFQIYKVGDVLQVNYGAGVAQGSALTWSNAITVNKTGTTWLSLPSGGCYMNNNATVTAVAANTWTKLAGTTTSLLLEQFTMPSNNRITYTGTLPIIAKITAFVTLSHSSITNQVCGISIFKNGSKVTPSEQYGTVGSALFMGMSGYTCIPVTTRVSLSTNDYVEVYGLCGAAVNLTPSYFTFLVEAS